MNEIFIAIMLTTAIVGYDIAHTPKTIPVVKAVEVVEEKATPEPADTPENYIRRVFGDSADKAMLLLKGNEKCQGENPKLDINALNDNTWWGGIGKDWGLFQINDVFHPVYKLNLHTDWKANVDYAYRMYLNDGGSFRRWTAGKCLWQGK